MSKSSTLDALRRAKAIGDAGGELSELLPNAIEPEDLRMEVVEGDDAEVAAVWLSDDVGRRWLFVPISPDEMAEIDPKALEPVRDFSKQRRD